MIADEDKKYSDEWLLRRIEREYIAEVPYETRNPDLLECVSDLLFVVARMAKRIRVLESMTGDPG